MRGKTQVPEGWQVVRLGDVAEVNPRRPQLNVADDTWTKFLPMTAVGEHVSGVIESENRPYGEVSSGYTYFEEYDVIFAKITPCLQNGKHALVRDLPNGFGFGSTEFHVVRAGEFLDPRHLFRALTQPRNIRECVNSFTGTAGQQRVQPDVLKSIPIFLPPLPEQRAIAAVLDSIDDAIESTEAVIAATEHLRDSLLHELLTRGVPGWHTEWKDAPGIGTIPACWDVVQLGKVAEVQTGRAVNQKNSRNRSLEVPYLSVANVKDGYLDLRTVKTMLVSEDEVYRYKVNDGDVLFTEGGDADKLGRGTVWKDEIALCLHQNHIFAVRPDLDILNSDFLASYAASNCGKRYFLGAAKQTTNLASINASQLRLMPVPLPMQREQQAVIGALDGVDEAIERARAEQDSLTSLKASAADALLSGRVRVRGETKFPHPERP